MAATGIRNMCTPVSSTVVLPIRSVAWEECCKPPNSYFCGSTDFDWDTLRAGAINSVCGNYIFNDWIRVDSGQVFLVLVRVILLAHLLHFLWNDDGGSHTQQSTRPNPRILLLLVVQPLLRLLDCQASEYKTFSISHLWDMNLQLQLILELHTVNSALELQFLSTCWIDLSPHDPDHSGKTKTCNCACVYIPWKISCWVLQTKCCILHFAHQFFFLSFR